MAGLSNVKLHFIDSFDDVTRFFQWLGERRPLDAIAIDTESSGLRVGHDIVRTIQVGDGEHGWVAPWFNETGVSGEYLPGWGHALFYDVVKKWPGDYIMHNAKFDKGMLDHMRVNVPKHRIRDTRIMAHVLEPHRLTALKEVANRYVDGAASISQFNLTKSMIENWDWGTIPVNFQDYWTYAALDPVLTYRVDEILYPKVMSDAPVAFDLENKVLWTIYAMERYGAYINVDYAKQSLEAFRFEVERIEQECKEKYKVSPGSNAAVVRVLQDVGYEFTKATATGAVALDKEVLSGIDHELARWVLRRRKLQKLASTYLEHFVNDVDSDSLLHPSINTLGARTSRMSMSDPNFQNLPRRSDADQDATTVRRSVERRTENHTMIMCDFDQVEMRIMADFCQDPGLRDAFKGDTDFFTRLARAIYSDDSIIKQDPRRQVTKNAGYATIYGAGIEKFAITAGVSIEQARLVRTRWDQLYPGTHKFQNDIINLAISRRELEGLPYVRCPITGRKQVADPGKEYALVNYLIQGAAAAIFKQKLLALDEAGLGQWMVVPVHDEIVLDVPNEHVYDTVHTLDAIMNDNETLSVPLTASVSSGQTWGDKTDWKWTKSGE